MSERPGQSTRCNKKNDLEKNPGFKTFCVGVEPAEMDVPPADPSRREEDDSSWRSRYET